MTLEGIRGVTFDAGGTLITPDPSVGAVYAEVAAAHGIDTDENELEGRFRNAFQRRNATGVRASEETERRFWFDVVREVFEGAAPDESIDRLFPDLWESFAEARRWRPLPGAGEVLEKLKGRGYSVAILSNWDSRLHPVVEGLRWSGWLDGVFISSEVGFAKPHRGIFDHVARTLGLKPHELIHVGDSAEADAAGATAAGWSAALLGGGRDDALAIRQLDELLSLLK